MKEVRKKLREFIRYLDDNDIAYNIEIFGDDYIRRYK